MKSNEILRIIAKRKNVSYGQIARAKGLDRRTVQGIFSNQFNNKGTNTFEFTEFIEMLGYTCVVMPKSAFDQNRDLIPQALELTSTSEIDKDFKLICPNCGCEIADQDIANGKCSHCNGKILINLYPPESGLKEIDFEKDFAIRKGGRPFKINSPEDKERKEINKKVKFLKGETKKYERKVQKEIEHVTFDYSKENEERKENEDDIRLFKGIYDDPS